MGDHAEMLASQARSVATSFETAKHSTPSPQEFAQARQELQSALERFSSSKGANAAEVQQKSQDLAYKQTQATSAATAYHSAVSSGGLSSSAESMKLAPPIAGGSATDSSGVEAVDWKPGDKLHFPIIRGPNGMGPAQPGYGPGWVELGPGSGNFVHEDELPGLKILEPGALGPGRGRRQRRSHGSLYRTGQRQRRVGARERLSACAVQTPRSTRPVWVRGISAWDRHLAAKDRYRP